MDVKGHLHLFLILILDEYTQSDSCPSHFRPGEEDCITHSTEGWLDPKGCTGALKKKKKFYPCPESNLDSPIVQLEPLPCKI
jgi:hypothetical protein